MTGPELLVEALPDIAARMSRQAEPIAAGVRGRLDERSFQRAVRATLVDLGEPAGIAVEATERTVRPDDWPRVGRIDVVLSPCKDRGAATFLELKWGAKDALWNCIWDVAKCALMVRCGYCRHAVLLAGCSAKEWEHPRYGALFADRDCDTAKLQRRYASDWRYWTGPPEPGKTSPKGPYRLPSRMSRRVLRRQPFRLDGQASALAAMEVTAPGDDWIELDQWALPRRPA
jgi:hypothetical protein